MYISIGAPRHGAYGGYGDTGGSQALRNAYADVPIHTWQQAISHAIATGNEVSQSHGDTLVQNNRESARLIRKTRQNNEVRAAVGDFLELFPIPSGKENNNPSLKQLEDILAKRAEDREDTSYKKGPAYDQQKLTEMNRMLQEMGMVPRSENSTKGDLETLRTRLDGLRDEISGFQTMANSQQGMLVGNISQHQTSVQGLIKANQSIGMGYARIPGSV